MVFQFASGWAFSCKRRTSTSTSTFGAWSFRSLRLQETFNLKGCRGYDQHLQREERTSAVAHVNAVYDNVCTASPGHSPGVPNDGRKIRLAWEAMMKSSTNLSDLINSLVIYHRWPGRGSSFVRVIRRTSQCPSGHVDGHLDGWTTIDLHQGTGELRVWAAGPGIDVDDRKGRDRIRRVQPLITIQDCPT
jgi:hypothetical protein